MHRTFCLALVAIAVVGCGSQVRAAHATLIGPATTTTSRAGVITTAATTTSPPPNTVTVTTPTVTPPQRIVLIGDSIMDEITPAVTAATAGRATVQYVLTTGAAKVSEAWWQIWAPLIASAQPDAVAVFIGPWEITAPDLGTPAWAAWYGARLDAWSDLLTAGGAHLYWVLPVPVRDSVSDAKMSIVREAYVQLARRRHDTTVINAAAALGSAQYLEHALSGARLRRTDGLHLCPAGAILITEGLLSKMGIQPAVGWLGTRWEVSEPTQSPAWAIDEPAYSPLECPA
jgi:hypothetical protein